MDVHAGVDQGPQVRRGDMFVVEGQHVQAAGELEQMLQVLVVADRGVGHGRDCGDVLAFGENTELKAQGGRGRGHHAGKLAAANNTDYRKSHKSQPTENLTGTRLSGIGKRGNAAGTVPTRPGRPARSGSRRAAAAGGLPGNGAKMGVWPNGRQFQKAMEGHDYYT